MFASGGKGRGFVVAALVFAALLAVSSSDAATSCGGMAATIVGTPGNDVLTGTSGNDVIVAGGGNDRVDGLAGDDRICGEAGLDAISGGSGNDTLHGGTENDQLNGNGGDDSVLGQAGDDTVDGGGGKDLLLGHAGSDTYIGGAGIDAASFASAAGPVVVDLQAGTALGEGSDSLNGVENVSGSPFGDTIAGDALANLLSGGNGNDVLWGLEEADSLIGGPGDDAGRGGLANDLFDGGTGFDRADYASAPGPVVVDLSAKRASGGDGNDSLRNVEAVLGSPHADTLTGDALANALAGGDGQDRLRGGGGADALDGGPAHDIAIYAGAPRGVTVDLAAGQATGEGSDTLAAVENVDGSDWDDFLYGDAGSNTLNGFKGSDVLMGFDGFDALGGGEGDDTLRGGPDEDLLHGGFGTDACVEGETLASCEKGGGTLVVDSQPDFDFVDPALASFTHSYQLHAMTCARLLAHPDASAPEGSRLVPDAAEALPTVSPDGRTYTFKIRPGVRFSPPSNEVVTAETFKFSIERAVHPDMGGSFVAGFGFLDDVVGYAGFRAGTAPGISGIVASGNKLSVTLVAPRGDLPARLAMTFFCAVPLSTPVSPQFSPLPSAGPYYLASWTRGSGAEAVRNPNYRGPRASNFDSVNWVIGVTTANQRLRIEANTTDVGTIPAENEPEIAAAYGEGSPAAQAGRQRYFTPPQAVFWYVVLNTSRPTFADENLRKAVAYAIDRTHLASLHRGSPTDQILPPGITGFRDDDVYPLTPDPAAAESYAAAAGVTPSSPITVELYTFNSSVGPGFASHLQSVLAPLGINMNVHSFDRVTQHEKIATQGEPFDLSIEGWGVDYNDPYNFLDMLLHGDRIRPTGNLNVSYFDDPTFNARLDAAAALSGPPRFAAYADLDRDLSDAAPIVPYANTRHRAFFSDRIGCHAFPAALIPVALNALCLR